ncbi:MAG: ATP12 family chaperone protein [Rhodovarius sp.]|nr:ATP12 family chaperone protein [Rhodovarius sp.]
MKRFWEEVRLERRGARLAILLDGRPVRLPGGAPLSVAEEPLAQALVEEWRAAGGAKGGEFRLEDIPLTRLVGTAQERIAPDPAPVIEELLRYGGSDLLCYRAEDRRLAERQQAEWDPWLAWAEEVLGAPLRATTGIRFIPQPEASLAALRFALSRQSPLALAALGLAVPALGSLVLGLALAHGALAAEAAHRLSILDELYQEERWGSDREALARRRAIARDVALAARLIALTTPG